MLAAIQWPFKLIQHRGYDRLNNSDELFDLENDPDELGNLTSQKHLPRLLSSKKHTKIGHAQKRPLYKLEILRSAARMLTCVGKLPILFPAWKAVQRIYLPM